MTAADVFLLGMPSERGGWVVGEEVRGGGVGVRSEREAIEVRMS